MMISGSPPTEKTRTEKTSETEHPLRKTWALPAAVKHSGPVSWVDQPFLKERVWRDVCGRGKGI